MIENIILPKASEISRKGYTFVGWYNNAEFGGNIITEIPQGSIGDIALYAKWILNQPEDNNPENNDIIDNPDDYSISDEFDGESVITGDTMNISIWFVIIVAALGVMIFAIKRKKK